jgi:hypothetical protein
MSALVLGVFLLFGFVFLMDRKKNIVRVAAEQLALRMSGEPAA